MIFAFNFKFKHAQRMPTAAEKAMDAFPNAFLLCFTRSNAYRDSPGAYKGQNKSRAFDSLMGDNDIKMVLVHQDGEFYRILGSCVNRAYNDNVRATGHIPTCVFSLSADHGLVAQVPPTRVREERHCWRQKFLRDHNLRKVSGGIGNGIMLVVPTN